MKRFPRLLEGAEAVALEKMIWNTPEFRPRLQPDEQAIDFIFRLRFSQRRKRYHSLRYILFGPGSKSWEKSFRSVYSRVPYGDKNLEQSISNRLHKLFVEGVKLWLHKTWSLKGIPKNTNK